MLIRRLYTFVLGLASPFLMWGLYKKRDGKPAVGHRWKEHFGQTPPLAAAKAPIWIHAVSVGETIAVTPFVRALKQQYPDQSIVITTTTPTGAEQAAKLCDIAEHRYMPFDFPFAVKGFLDSVRPSQLLIMETELWPNTLHTVAKAGIPITVINARLSERSCQRYAKFQRVFDLLAGNLTRVLCQYPDDAARFVRLGLSPDKVAVTGSIKFDISPSPDVIEQGLQLRQTLGPQRPVWIAASTHPGEDEQLLEAHAQLLATKPDALLILVPRHPERFNDVFALCQARFACERRTESRGTLAPETQVYLADTMGEMLQLIGAADLCFMGGSLIGDKVGGHNVLEPAALGTPILTGPSYYNFADITESLAATGGLAVVTTPAEIAHRLCQLWDSPEQMSRQHDSLLAFVEANRGANQRTLDSIMPPR